MLLKKLYDCLFQNGNKNLVSGFAKCGIISTIAKPLLDRILSYCASELEIEIDNAFLRYLEKNRSEPTSVPRKNI